MRKTLHRLVAMLLVLTLFASMLPTAFAAETETTAPTESTTIPAEETAPEETTVPEAAPETEPPTEESTEAAEETEPPMMEEYSISTASEDYGIMTAASSRLSNVTLLDLASPYNYTIMLPSQVAVQYKPKGTGSSKTAYLKNIAWHYYSYGGVGYRDDPIYCIEPYKNYAASTPGNYADQGVDVYGSNTSGSTGSNVWYSMPSSYRKAIAYILQCSEMRWDYSVSAANVSKNNNPNFPLRTATQILIYEIVMGLRNPDTFYLNSSNGYEDGDILYNAFVNQVSGFSECYHAIVSDVQSASLIPSFCSANSSSAPTINLAEDSVLTWIHDDNGVMSNFTFTEDDRIYFNVYGNDLCIENYGDFTGTKTYSCYRAGPSASSSTFNIFYPADSSYQTCVNLLSPATSYTYGYFKLYAPVTTGDFNIIKTTSDGQNLSGWKFSLYFDSACTRLFAGPYTTSSTGRISFTGTTPGSYYIREEGHTDPAIEAKYTCTSANPQKIVVTAGQTSSVTFTNTLKPGTLNLVKTTSDGQNLEGWQFNIYSDAACSRKISGPHTTDSNGKLSVSLSAGTLYVKEVGHVDSSINSRYTCTSTNPQAVNITAGGTASVTFVNTLQPGEVIIKKVTSDGENLAGWQFSVYQNADCTQKISGPHVTDSSGIISAGSFEWDVIYIREEGHEDPSIASQYTCTGINPQTVVSNHGGTSTVTFHNTLSLGRIEILKTTNTGNHLDGWVFRITDSDGNEVAELVTDENGYAISGDLPAGRYLVQELHTDDDYWQITLGGHDVIVKAGETSVDEWHNVEQGLARIYKKTNTGESVEGWEITIYSDEACTQEIYTLTTNEDGYAGYYMSPGTYWAKETGDTEGRFDSEYWLVDERIQKFEVKPHEDVSIEFSNVQYGKLKVIKTMEGEGPLEGWQFKVTDSDGKEIDGSPFTTQEDGTILIGSLLPGELTVEEILPEDSPYTCTSENPQKVTIQAGTVTEVTFTNALIPGKITIHKVDNTNEPLAGATFLLEWSEDGIIWWPVTYSSEKIVTEGGCDNPNVKDGCLTSGTDGLLEWSNLYPTLYYRVTELEAPEGYELLKDYAYEGLLPEETLELSFRVINCPGFTLPDTGAASGAILRIGQLLCLIGTVYLLLVAHNKKKKG